MRRNELPDACFSILPSTGQLIIIKKGESGYYPSEWDTGNREENRDIASSHNESRGISDMQESAMLAGSMFGWNTPGANPQWYLDTAKYVNSNILQGHIKDPIMSVYYPVSSFLLCYEIMGKQHFYLPMDKLPNELMGMNTQFIMQPDLVCGVPVMPVKVTFAKNGSCTMELEHGSYVVGKIINADYQIIPSWLAGTRRIAAGTTRCWTVCGPTATTSSALVAGVKSICGQAMSTHRSKKCGSCMMPSRKNRNG